MGEELISRHLPEVWRIRHGDPDSVGWNVKLRKKFDYYTPDEWYCAALMEYVTPQTTWLDAGCGRDILPQNPPLARILADRCSFLFGIDPSDNMESNPFLHGGERCSIESFRTDRRFDLISMRMVAEHIADPQSVIATLSKLLSPGGRLLVYTVWKWSPASVVAVLTPMSVHHAAKKVLWDTEERDTFPVVYAMNTKTRLDALAKTSGLATDLFLYLDDCRSFQRWKTTCAAELNLWRALKSIGLRYPEACLLTVMRKPV